MRVRLPEEISSGANARAAWRGVVARRVPDASDIYCELLRALAADTHSTSVR